jgi:hypothetical protein
MSKQQAPKPFDPGTFMAAFDGGVTVSTYGEGQTVFSQGAPADAVFYIQGRGRQEIFRLPGRKNGTRWAVCNVEISNVSSRGILLFVEGCFGKWAEFVKGA